MSAASRKRKLSDTMIDVYDPPKFKINSLDDLIELGNSANKPELKKNKDLKNIQSIIPELKALNEMIGMNDLKKQLIYQILMICQGLEGDEMMHTALMGPPGVGKTTIAQLIGKIYCKMGFLSHGHFKVVGREDLIGKYLGETAQKTKKVLTSAVGGVLFIDEAYSLGNPEGRDSYAKECIDTLNKFLSENTEDFICIIAGYKENLNDSFFGMNPGLNRRFPWKYNIEHYKPSELVDIFEKQLMDSQWRLRKEEFKDRLFDIIETSKDRFKYNGGDTENFLASCKMAHSSRMFGKIRTWKRYLTLHDIDVGMEIFIKNKKSAETSTNKESLGHLYM